MKKILGTLPIYMVCSHYDNNIIISQNSGFYVYYYLISYITTYDFVCFIDKIIFLPCTKLSVIIYWQIIRNICSNIHMVSNPTDMTKI